MGKLVRDRIPELIRAGGGEPRTRVLLDPEYDTALRDKLVEEAEEVRAATDAIEILAEAADVYEVLLALTDRIGVGLEAVAEAAKLKRLERGSFNDRLWLESY